MKGSLVVIVTLFSAVVSVPAPRSRSIRENAGANARYLLVEESPGVYVAEDLTADAEISTFASATSILYYFFNQNDTSVGTQIPSNNVGALETTEFSTDLDTVVLIHGWNGNKTDPFNLNVTPAILGPHDVNLFVVDWGALAITDYPSARYSVPTVGSYVASFIQSLVTTYGLSLSKVTLIGFSLGAHVAGRAGAVLSGQVDLIIGLDPAGPLFSIFNTAQRLDPSDAQYVHIIHTSTLLGYDFELGDADFYPNGGKSQPGCDLDVTQECAHKRSYVYYAESVLASPNLFKALECSLYASYNSGFCNGNDESVMGGYPVDETASGSYYLNTNSASPFGKG